AETVRGFLTTPIERAVSAIGGVDYIESTSRAGVSTVTVRLKLNYNSTAALEGVQRVSNSEGGRPIAMRVWIDPDRLAAVNLAPGDVYAALQRNNYLA